MEVVEVISNPRNKMIFECAFNNLMQEVTRYELVDIRVRKVVCERLEMMVSDSHTSRSDPLTTTSGFIPQLSHSSVFFRCSTMRSDHACERGGEDGASRFDEWAVHL